MEDGCEQGCHCRSTQKIALWVGTRRGRASDVRAAACVSRVRAAELPRLIGFMSEDSFSPVSGD